MSCDTINIGVGVATGGGRQYHTQVSYLENGLIYFGVY